MNKPQVTFLPPAPQEETFQAHAFDENLGSAPLLQKTGAGTADMGGPKGWEKFFKFLDKAGECLK